MERKRKRGVERWKGRVRERGEIYEERKEKKRKEGGQRRTEERKQREGRHKMALASRVNREKG